MLLGNMKHNLIMNFSRPSQFTGLVYIIVCAGIGKNKMQDLAGVADAGAEILRHGADVFHDRLGVGENILVDPLQNIGLSAVGLYLAGQVDVAAAEFGAAHGSSFDLKVSDSRFCAVGQNGIILSVIFLIL